MKVVLALLLATSAVAQNDFSDEALTLLQVRSSAFTPGGQTSKEEEVESEEESKDAIEMAQKAKNLALDAEKQAEEAEQIAADEADDAAQIPVPQKQDEASAVGDPHMNLNTGDDTDLCCTGSVCEPCDYALLQQGEEDTAVPGRGEADRAQNEADDAVQLAQTALNTALDAQNKADDAAQLAADEADDAAQIPVPQQKDEAAAVGDPHMTLKTGEHRDLCCTGSHCEPCDMALLQPHDEEKTQAQNDAEVAVNIAQDAVDESMKAEEKAAEAEEIVGDALAEVDPAPEGVDEAAAVGDPHMTKSTGDKTDLCCKGGHCKPC